MKPLRFVLSWILFGAALLWATALPGGAQQESPQLTFEDKPTLQSRSNIPPPPLVTGGPAPDLELLYSSEVRGYYQPCG
jgi:hypothetical protein